LPVSEVPWSWRPANVARALSARRSRVRTEDGDMARGLLAGIGMLLLILGCHGCAPTSTQEMGAVPPCVGEILCAQCGGTRFDVERHTERTGLAGEEKTLLEYTCQGCGHSWRAPALGE
jgi:DNA-directed RNA polymerase subunit M/transcription elongation factor TFIIS